MKKLKLLIIQGYGTQEGGNITFIRHLVNYIDKTKFETTLLFLSPGKLVNEFHNKRFNVAVIKSGKVRNISLGVITILRIVFFIHKHKFNVVFSNDCREHIYGGTAAWLAGVPSTFFWHGFFAPLPLLKLALLVPTSAIFTNSKEIKQAIDNYLNYKKKTRFITLGVELPNLPSKNELRAKLGFDSCIPIITQVSVFLPFKGHRYLIEASLKIIKIFPETKFFIVGNAPFPEFKSYKTKMENIVKNLGLEKNIMFLGHREDVLEIMSASDIIVHPIVAPEPFGFIIPESWSCARPIIASNIGGPKEIIEDGVDGILIPPKDSNTLAKVTLRLLKNKKLCKEMGKNGRKKVEKYFRANKMVKEIEEIWLNLIHS
ncbi:glycosyltransferase family 4 protein [candidate division WOR-3 bacterium]|nr:glycosyltransferase family 4 protein [candidate division WOR-3 bacterium]